MNIISYLNYEDKTKVFKHKENFERYNQTSNLKQLKVEGIDARKLAAFQKEPLIYGIQVIDATYLAVVQGEPKQAIQEMIELVGMKELNIDPITLVNAYVTLATAYQIEE